MHLRTSAALVIYKGLENVALRRELRWGKEITNITGYANML